MAQKKTFKTENGLKRHIGTLQKKYKLQAKYPETKRILKSLGIVTGCTVGGALVGAGLGAMRGGVTGPQGAAIGAGLGLILGILLADPERVIKIVKNEHGYILWTWKK